MELKTMVVAKDGQALLGRHFHTLNYFTRKTFSTNMIITLIQYISTIITDVSFIVFNARKITVMPSNPNEHSGILATCELNNSPIMDLLNKYCNRELTLQQLETFLYDIRKHWGSGTDCKDLYDHVRDFTLKKLTTFERKKDNQGNFIFAYSRKDEKGDIEPPKPIKLVHIPIFNLHNAELPEIEFDVNMEFEQHDDSAEVTYTLRNPFFNQIVMEAQKAAIEGYLAGVPQPFFWGEAGITTEDDGKKYMENGLKA